MLKKGDRLVVATHNKGKVVEIGHLLEPYGMRAVSAGELDISEPDETGVTFAENACQKAVHSAKASGLPALADDSGLEVAALNGDPGIYSARWGGPDKDFDMAMERVHKELEAKGAVTPEQRSANFNCVLALALPDGQLYAFMKARCLAPSVWPMRGSHGFGYDPIFMPDKHDITFGEMDPKKKHEMSHRARAFEIFIARSALRPNKKTGTCPLGETCAGLLTSRQSERPRSLCLVEDFSVWQQLMTLATGARFDLAGPGFAGDFFAIG